MNETKDYKSDWNEYKRLVLAELERLNECLEKLNDRQHSFIQNHDKELTLKLSEIAKSLIIKMKKLDSEIENQFGRDLDILMQRVEKIESLIDKKDVIPDGETTKLAVELLNNNVAFWTAVITIFGSLITSLASFYISSK